MVPDTERVDSENVFTTSKPPMSSQRPARRRGTTTGLAGPSALQCIVSLHGSGASPHTAAAALNGGGSRTTDGMRWTASTVAHVLSEEIGGGESANRSAIDADARAARQVRAVGELGQAITTGQLEVHYQSVVDMVSGGVVSLEALVRWRHPTRGLVPPSEFIPFAEKCGLITELTEFVARTVIEQMSAWVQTRPLVKCAINLSASSLRDPLSSARLLALLRHHAQLVTVEVTESVLCDEHAVEVLRALAESGVDIAIDDFGTGYSCLAMLKDFPASTLKIDQSFLTDVESDDRACAVVAAIVQLARGLGLDVIAEGVECEAVATRLLAQGVGKAQGFLYARPVSANELGTWQAGPRPRSRAS